MKLSKILKILAKIVGVLFISYGFIIGILGVCAEGPVNSIIWRFIGLIVLLEGILYFIANQKLCEKPMYIYMFIMATISPTIALIVMSLINLYQEGLLSFLRFALPMISILVPVSLLAPLSLIFYMKERERSGNA